MNDFIGAAARSYCIWLGAKGEAHREDIPHSLAQRRIGPEAWISIDIRVYLQLSAILVKEVAQVVGDLNRFRYLMQHTLLDSHALCSTVRADIHISTFALAQDQDHGGKLYLRSIDLRVGADTDLDLIAEPLLVDQCLLHRFFDRAFYPGAIQLSPFPIYYLFHWFVFQPHPNPSPRERGLVSHC